MPGAWCKHKVKVGNVLGMTFPCLHNDCILPCRSGRWPCHSRSVLVPIHTDFQLPRDSMATSFQNVDTLPCVH